MNILRVKDEHIELSNLAYVTNEDGHVVLFNKEVAKDFIEEFGENSEDILIIPELECDLFDPMEAI